MSPEQLKLRLRIIEVLTTRQWPLSDEKLLQPLIAIEFVRAGLSDIAREVHLGKRDIVDFLIGDVAVEVKVKGDRRAIYRQLERYCGYEAVGAIVLATNVPMNLPELIEGKPASIAALGRGWL